MLRLLSVFVGSALILGASPGFCSASNATKTKAHLRAKVKAHSKAKAQAKAEGPAAVAAKDYFGRQAKPSPAPARVYGAYARGCLAGAKMLPINGSSWQVMRLSRNRNWGHPELVDFIERFSKGSQQQGWSGMLVGDMAQPMGGPMSSGHASHQIGMDVDFWLNPMPAKTYTAEERENISAVSMLASDGQTVDPNIWTETHAKLLKHATSYPEVARIFVHPAIKKALCESAGADKAWLHKIEPWWGHHYHFHVRLSCPKDSPECENQRPLPDGDGCGAELEKWLKMIKKPDKPETPPKQPTTPPKSKPPITLAELPPACTAMLKAAGALDPGKTAGTTAATAATAATAEPQEKKN